MPDDWLPSEELKAQARAAYPRIDLDQATTEFVRYWLAESDPKGRKADWDATWLIRVGQLARVQRPQATAATPFRARESIKPPSLTADEAYGVEVEQLDLMLANGCIDEPEYDRKLAEASDRRRSFGSSPGSMNAGTGSAKTRQPQNDPKGAM